MEQVIQEQKKRFSGGKLQVYWWVYFAALTVASVLLTQSGAENTGFTVFLMDVALIVPRMMTLILFCLPVQLSSYRKSLTFIMSAAWFVWIGLSYSHFTVAAIPGAFLLVLGLFCFFKFERNNPTTSEYYDLIKRLTFLTYFSLTFILILEILQDLSITVLVKNMVGNPDMLACNLLYFAAFGSFCFWVPKKKTACVIYYSFWLILACGSLIKTSSNYEPILLLDIFSLFDAVPAALNIYGILLVILTVAVVIGVVTAVILVAKKEEKQPVNKNYVIRSCIFSVVAFLSVLFSSHLPHLKYETSLPKEAYDRNGFVYSFLTYSFESTKMMPDDYSEQTVDLIIDKVDAESDNSKDTENPIKNIIVVQMESFVDPYDITGAEYEYDPIPFMHSLQNSYTSGKVDVPVFGGQTVKTEFEFLTAMSISALPFGYSPYVQELNRYPVDSFPRYLKSLGYETTAIHDYQGEFFSRYLVYENMGFDRFVPYECMSGVQKREGDLWANDSILAEYMDKVLKASKKDRNFIFTVTVQTHGAYPVIKEREDFPMEISGISNQTLLGKVAYYVNELQQVDKAMQLICEYFENRNEPTVILFYSDHLPTFFSDVQDYDDTNRFTTSFFTWNNIGLSKKTGDRVNMGRLSTYLCDMIGLEGSFMNRFHRVFGDNKYYDEDLEIIQYYKLFEEYKNGDKYLENDSYEIGAVHLSIADIKPEENVENAYIITGTGLTDNVYLKVNGKLYNMEYIDSNHMLLENYKKEFKTSDEICVVIVGERDGNQFRESEPYEWR